MVPKNNRSFSNYNVISNSDSDDEGETEEGNVFEQDIEDELEVTLKTTLNPKVVREIKNFQAF